MTVPSQEIAHPTFAAVRAIHREVLSAHGGSDGLRDVGLLESALAAPQATFGGESMMTDGGDLHQPVQITLTRRIPPPVTDAEAEGYRFE